MRSTLAVGLTCLVIALPAVAQSRVIPYPVKDSQPFAAAMEAGTRTPTGVPGGNWWSNTSDYSIRASLDPATARLDGIVRITYHNNSPHTLRRLYVHLRQNLHKQGVVRNVPVHITGGVTVRKVSLDGKKLSNRMRRSGGYRVAGTIMEVRLAKKLSPRAKAVLEIEFSFIVPPTSGARRMGHEANHVFYLGYWYPQMAVYEDVRGWVAEPYMGGGEFYMGYGNYDLSITVPHGWLVRATGALENPEKVLPTKIRKRLKKARESREVVHVVGTHERGPGRSTLTSSNGKLTWRFLAENVRDCAVSVSDRYVWDATHATVKKGAGDQKDVDCMIHAVYEPDGGSGRNWRRAAEYSRHTIEYMSRNLHPYPWPQMTACEGIVGGGMEYPMMTCVGASMWPEMLQSVIAHELIHMWFPMIVGSDEKSWCWMDEGLTDFFTTQVECDFWKKGNPRKRAYVEYRDAARRGGEVPCMSHADSFNDTNRGPFYFASYAKPAATMHQLEAMLGGEVFTKGIRRYVSRWAYKHPHPVDLFRTFSEVAGRDLNWYFRTWLYETWTLDHGVGDVTRTDTETTVTIEDLGPAIGPAEVLVTYEDGREETGTVPASHWMKGNRKATLKFGPKVSTVQLDPRAASLDINRKNNTWGG